MRAQQGREIEIEVELGQRRPGDTTTAAAAGPIAPALAAAHDANLDGPAEEAMEAPMEVVTQAAAGATAPVAAGAAPGTTAGGGGAVPGAAAAAAALHAALPAAPAAAAAAATQKKTQLTAAEVRRVPCYRHAYFTVHVTTARTGIA